MPIYNYNPIYFTIAIIIKTKMKFDSQQIEYAVNKMMKTIFPQQKPQQSNSKRLNQNKDKASKKIQIVEKSISKPTFTQKQINNDLKKVEAYSNSSNSDIEEGKALFQQMSSISNIVKSDQELQYMIEEKQQEQEKPQQNKQNINQQPEQQQPESQKDKLEVPKSILKKPNNRKFHIDTTIMENVQVANFNPDRKWNQQIINQKKGKFSNQQFHLLIGSIDTYARTNNMKYSDVIQALYQQQGDQKKKKSQKMWTKICSVLPNRPLSSSFKFLRRALHKDNYNGEWKQQQIALLIQLIEKHGKKWNVISKIMKRTAQNIRDKYRQLGQDNQDYLQKFWNFEELVNFLLLLEKYSEEKFINPDIKLELQKSTLYDEQQKVQQRQKKYNTKSFIFKNISIISQYITNTQFRKIDTQKINWVKISNKLKTKTVLQCRNKYVQLMSINFKRESNTENDIQIYKFVSSQKVKCEQQIKWNEWSNEETMEQAIKRWKILKKHVQGRKTKSLHEILENIRQMLQNKVNKQNEVK